MNPCEDCLLDDKIYECCGRYPETGATVPMVLENVRTLIVCPYLTNQGICRIYEQRPMRCRTYECLRPGSRYQYAGTVEPTD